MNSKINKIKKILLITLIFSTVYTNAQCWKSISVGELHSVGIKTDNTLWSFGQDGEWGRLGAGDIFVAESPIQISNTTDWKEVNATDYHNIAIKINGTLWAWGNNGTGQLGDGTLITKNIPTQIGTSQWKMVRAGRRHSIGIKADGTLWGWGGNQDATVGDGTFINRLTPVLINSSTNWKMVSCNLSRNIAVKTDGTLWAWGMNSPFLGFSASDPIGGQTYVKVPSQIGLETDWKYAVSGNGYFLALKNDNTLWAWGGGANGKLGNGSTTSIPWPTQIGTATDWEMIEADSFSSFAIKTDGTLWAWGHNMLGNLGNGTQTDILVPTQITTATDWITVSTSAASTAALKIDGSLYTWGFNEWGNLGDGTYINQFTPQVINTCALGTEDFTKNNVVLYPNPAHDKVNIRFETDAPTSQVEVYDLMGRLISSFESTAKQGVIELDLAPMATGVYVVVLRQGTQILMQRKLQVY